MPAFTPNTPNPTPGTLGKPPRAHCAAGLGPPRPTPGSTPPGMAGPARPRRRRGPNASPIDAPDPVRPWTMGGGAAQRLGTAPHARGSASRGAAVSMAVPTAPAPPRPAARTDHGGRSSRSPRTGPGCWRHHRRTPRRRAPRRTGPRRKKRAESRRRHRRPAQTAAPDAENSSESILGGGGARVSRHRPPRRHRHVQHGDAHRPVPRRAHHRPRLPRQTRPSRPPCTASLARHSAGGIILRGWWQSRARPRGPPATPRSSRPAPPAK